MRWPFRKIFNFIAFDIRDDDSSLPQCGHVSDVMLSTYLFSYRNFYSPLRQPTSYAGRFACF